MEAEFAELTKAVSDRMTVMCKLEKETWQKLDSLEIECEKLRQEVTEKTKDMVFKLFFIFVMSTTCSSTNKVSYINL